MGKAQHTLAMEQTLKNYDFGLKDANLKILKKNTDNVIKSHKCNQCNYASSRAGDLRRHLKTHGGEKLNKSDAWKVLNPLNTACDFKKVMIQLLIMGQNRIQQKYVCIFVAANENGRQKKLFCWFVFLQFGQIQLGQYILKFELIYVALALVSINMSSDIFLSLIHISEPTRPY